MKVRAFSQGVITAVAATPDDGSHIAAASWTGHVGVWSVSALRHVWSAQLRPRGVLGMVSLDNEELLVSGGGSGDIVVASFVDGHIRSRRAAGSTIVGLAACSSRAAVLVGRGDGSIERWCTVSWQRIWRYEAQGPLHRIHELGSGAIAQFRDGRVLVLDDDGSLHAVFEGSKKRWILAPLGDNVLFSGPKQFEVRTRDGRSVRGWSGTGVSCVTSLGSERVAIAVGDKRLGSLRILDSSLRCVAKSPLHTGWPVFAITRCGDKLVAADRDGVLTMWTPRYRTRAFGTKVQPQPPFPE
jgi:hypothetical protein